MRAATHPAAAHVLRDAPGTGGYRPDVGFVSIALPYDDRWYFAEALRGATKQVEAAGHELWVHVIPPSATASIALVDEIGGDFGEPESLGAIVVGFKYQADQRPRVLAWERPVVILGGSVLGFPTVMIDDVGASWTATDHLMQLGHTRITHFAGDLDGQMDFSVHGRRARGYRLAVERAGIAPSIVEVGFDPDEVHATALTVLDRPDRPTAVFAVSDEIAFPVMAAAAELGLVIGTDLSVVGFDDHPRAEAEHLTTIRQRPEEQGAAAADMILSGIGHGPDPKQSKLMSTQLVARESSRRLRGA
jgi:LacI family transcriptional regulator, repressor for deo operon, udp, cdd, tsx, nupC, and nupG